MDDLVARFLPRFAALARERLQKATGIAAQRDRDGAGAVAHDLHSLAGEAGLLGLEGVIDLARIAEDAARRFGSSGSDGDAESFATCLAQLEAAVTEATAASGAVKS